MRAGQEHRPSWICRNEVERQRFVDLHRRLLRANTYILLALVALIVVMSPLVDTSLGVIPAAVGIVLFAGIQRNAVRFPRPELWVFAAMLGAEAMIVAALAVQDLTTTPGIALLCWPVAGVAGRFPNRASRLGTLFAAMLATGAALGSDTSPRSSDVLALGLLLLALAAIHSVATVLRQSDVEHRGAAILDSLTGMLNRTALMHRTEEIEVQSRRSGEPVAVLVADLDHFKQINDDYGHAAGDAVLRAVAERLREELRAYDLAYRLGGEEFVVLLLGGSEEATLRTAEELRAAIAATPLAGRNVTMSVGVATSEPGTPFVWTDVFARADAALYRAKSAGRDRVVAHRPLEGHGLRHT